MEGRSLIQYIVSGLATGGLYALLAVGFVVIYNVTGILNFAQGEFAAAGAIVAVALLGAGAPLPLACLGGVLAAAAVGLLVWQFALKGAYGSALVTQVIITIGLSLALRGIALLLFGPQPHPLPPFSPGSAFRIGAATVAPQQVWIFGIVFVLMIALYVLFERTRLGGALLASALNREASRLMGIDPLRMGAIALGLGAGLAGVAGVATAPISLVSYDMGLMLGLKGFVAAVLGGLVSVPGAVVGGLVLGVIESLGAGLLPSGWRDAIAFGILILVLLIRPQGLFGRSVARV